jgi:hypothetical protein
MDSLLSVLHAVTKDASLDPTTRKAAEAKMQSVLATHVHATAEACATPAKKKKKPSFVMALVRANPDYAFCGDVDLTGGAKGKVADLMTARNEAARIVLSNAADGHADAIAMIERAYEALGLPTPDEDEFKSRLAKMEADRTRSDARKADSGDTEAKSEKRKR